MEKKRRRTTSLGLALLSVVLAAMAVAVLLWAVGSAGASPPMKPLAQGAAPLLLNYQGRLADPTTTLPKPDGAYSITFKIHDAETGGSLIWSEAQVVTVTRGLFNVLLGSSTALSASDFDGTSRWLELEVEGETLSPRVRMVSVPYAIQAEEAKNAWRLTGNAGTTPGTYFLGTTDNQALQLHVNNARALRLEPNATSPNVIGGYSGNSVTSGVMGATIGGGGASGSTNRVTDDYGTVGGGYNNQAGDNAGNTYDRTYATVGGGYNNSASGQESTVGGGGTNAASFGYATIGGGQVNNASGSHTTIGGGLSNTASGSCATVPGGRSNEAARDYSFAAGRRAKANHDGAFVWADSTDADFASTANDQFMVRASGGITMCTNSNCSSGMYMAASGSSWIGVSDRELKENFAPVDALELLARLAENPITTWNYKAQDPSIRHVGPMAQDFNALLEGLGGEGEKYINTLDADGVALAAIQGLYQLSQEQAVRIEELETENAVQQAQIADLEERMTALESQSRAPLGSWGLLGLLFSGLLVGLVVVKRNDFGKRWL